MPALVVFNHIQRDFYMSKKITIGTSNFSISDQEFPLYLAPLICDLCKNLLQVRKQMIDLQEIRLEWENWSKKHSWPDNDLPDNIQNMLTELRNHSWSELHPLHGDVDILIQKLQKGVQYHQKYQHIAPRLLELEEQRKVL